MRRKLPASSRRSARIYMGLCFICAMRGKKPGHVNHLEGGQHPVRPLHPHAGRDTEKPGNSPSCLPMLASKRAPFDAAEQIQWYKTLRLEHPVLTGFACTLGGISIAELYRNPGKRRTGAPHHGRSSTGSQGPAATPLPEDLVEFHLSRTGNHGGFHPIQRRGLQRRPPRRIHGYLGRPSLQGPASRSPPCRNRNFWDKEPSASSRI